MTHDKRKIWKAIYQNMNCGGNTGDFIFSVYLSFILKNCTCHNICYFCSNQCPFLKQLPCLQSCNSGCPACLLAAHLPPPHTPNIKVRMYHWNLAGQILFEPES